LETLLCGQFPLTGQTWSRP